MGKFFDFELYPTPYEDWIEKHYDCPVRDITSVDNGYVVIAEQCTRHKDTYIKSAK